MGSKLKASRGAPQIFLSYAHQDYEKVKELYDKLLKAGYRPWIDKEELPPGVRWDVAIKKAIRDSDFFLACLSETSVNRKGVLQSEREQALEILSGMKDTDIYLIPVRLDDCDPPEILSRFQYVDLFTDRGWEVLNRGIRKAWASRRASGIESIPPPPPPFPIRLLPVLVPLFSVASNMADHRFIQTIRGEVSQTNSIVTVDRPGSELKVFFYYFTFYVVAAVIVWLVFLYARQHSLHPAHATWSLTHSFQGWSRILGVASTIAVTGFLLSLFVLEPGVDSMTDISGSASDQVRSYYLLVRPVGSARCWLQSPVPLLLDQEGKWHTTAFFGGIQGQRFEIIAIASKTPLHAPAPNPPGALAPFNKPDSYDCNLIPGNVERYVRVVVIK